MFNMYNLNNITFQTETTEEFGLQEYKLYIRDYKNPLSIREFQACGFTSWEEVAEFHSTEIYTEEVATDTISTWSMKQLKEYAATYKIEVVGDKRRKQAFIDAITEYLAVDEQIQWETEAVEYDEDEVYSYSEISPGYKTWKQETGKSFLEYLKWLLAQLYK